MDLENDIELAHTRDKLQHLEARYAALRNDAREDVRVRELTLRSLKSTINQLIEEIARYEAHRVRPHEAARS